MWLQVIRTVPNKTGFDRSVNAITGFNGRSKSNILDTFCFMVGITKLEQLQVYSFAKLEYKNGIKNLKTASVSVKFYNRDERRKPCGNKDLKEVTLISQCTVKEKNKYLINGTRVTESRLKILLCSVTECE